MKRDIRFLVTHSCNYRCSFCHNEGIARKTSPKLTVNDYKELFTIYSSMENWNGVSISGSGGEPLLFEQIDELCCALYNEGAKITLITNGSLLIEKLHILKYINQINVSIHSLDEDTYKKITGREDDLLPEIINNLRIVRNIYPQLNIRINITPTKDSYSLVSLEKFLNFAEEINASIKFTELFPQNHPECITVDNIVNSVLNLGYTEKSSYNNRARLFSKPNKPDILVSQCTCSQAKNFPVPINFCRETHDLYVTEDGKIPLCRLNSMSIDILSDLKEENEEELLRKLKLALNRIPNFKCKENLIKL